MAITKYLRDNGNIMTAYFSLPDSPELVVVSDVHIRGSDDERALLFLQFLDESIRVKTQMLVLNGDVFDFFFGWGNHFKQKYSAVFDRLEMLAAQGAKIYFVEGNHEFGMDQMRTAGVTYLNGFGAIIDLRSGPKVLVAHGDLMKNDLKYLTFRAIVRSRIFSYCALLVPHPWLDAWTSWFAKTSRKKDRYRTLNHQHILVCAHEVLGKSLADHLIFGHFHYPYDEMYKTTRRILSVDSWDYPSCLVFKDRGFMRIRPLKLK
ncbi:MAG: metallophosphoesterase [Proteobacteria bacterium]|nr:metallophosphoesterase [Pseudomonadota bacterium]